MYTRVGVGVFELRLPIVGPIIALVPRCALNEARIQVRLGVSDSISKYYIRRPSIYGVVTGLAIQCKKCGL